MKHQRKRRIAVLGASGTVGRRIVDRLLAGGFDVVCETRSGNRLAHLTGRADMAPEPPISGSAVF